MVLLEVVVTRTRHEEDSVALADVVLLDSPQEGVVSECLADARLSYDDLPCQWESLWVPTSAMKTNLVAGAQD